MFVVVCLMLCGVGLGYLLRGKMKIGWTSNAISMAIFVLLFLLGVKVGANPQIMDKLSTLGVDALVITVGALSGSILMAWLIYHFVFRVGNKH